MKKLLLFSSYFLVLTSLWAQGVVYYCDFDSPSDTAGWHFANGTQANRWVIGTDDGWTGNALYVTNIETATNYYDNRAASLSYAYRRVALDRGAYLFSYDWRCAGERNFDYLRVFLAPDSARVEAGVPPYGWSAMSYRGTPEGWLSLDGGEALYLSGFSSQWDSAVCEAHVARADTFKLVFVWRNDGSLGSQPPAAVDDVRIERPACQLPGWPYVDQLGATSFSLHWSDLGLGGSTAWLVELDSATQTLGQGMLYSVYDTMVSFVGLQPSTDYTMYVWTVCGTDTLDSAVVVRTHTPCVPFASLPFVQDFEGLATGSVVSVFPCWSSPHDTRAYVYPGADGSRFVRWRATALDLHQCLVLPGVDTLQLPMGGLQLSLLGRLSDGGRQRLAVGVMADHTNLDSFVPVDTICIDTYEWQRYVVEFGGYGGQYIAFVTMDEGTFNLDDVVVDRVAPCQGIHHLSATHVGTTGAMLSWELNRTMSHRPDSFIVDVRRTDGTDTANTFVTTEPRCLLTGLDPDAGYVARVRVRCDNDSLSRTDSVGFTTIPMPCAMADTARTDTLPFSSGTSHVVGVPVSYNNFYSLCQSVYTADELQAAGMRPGMVTGVDYTFTSSLFDHTVGVYATTAHIADFADTGSMVELLPQQLRSGPEPFPSGTYGTVHYTFDPPLSWNGLDNLVITTLINQDTGAMFGSMFYAKSTQSSGSKSLYRGQDFAPYTPANCMAGTASQSSYRPSVTFYASSCSVAAECASPTIVVEAVETHAAYLSWIPGGHEVGWDVYYRRVGDTAWSVADTAVSTVRNYYLSGLDASCRYQVRVAPRCGDRSLVAQTEFATSCAKIDRLPWTEDFEGFVAPYADSDTLQPCWYRFSRAIGVVCPYGENGALFFGSPRSYHLPYYSYIVLPESDFDVDGLLLGFRRYAEDYYQLRVGVMTDPEDYGTFTEVMAVTPATLHTWEQAEVPFFDYTGGGKYIALAVGPQADNEVYVDDMVLDYLPTCPRPWGVTVDHVTASTATLRWRGPYAFQYEVEYGPEGFEPGTGTVVASVDDSITLAGLDHSTSYDVRVRSLCAADTSQWSAIVTFATACGMIDRLPYVRTFGNEPLGEVGAPACWTCWCTYSSYTPSIAFRTTAMGQELGRALRMPSGSVSTYAMLPAVDTAAYALNSLQVVFKAGSDTAFTGANYRRTYYVVVGVATAPYNLSMFTPLDTVVVNEVPATYEVPLTGAVGAGRYITFVTSCSYGTNTSAVYLDSVVVERRPACARPYNLLATAVTQTTATLAWQLHDSPSVWQVEYMPHGVPLGSGTRVAAGSNPFTLTGLMPATRYDFYVRSICGTGDTSEWCYNPGQFITQQLPAMAPITYSFDSLRQWQEWQMLTNNAVGWYHGMADGQAAPSIYVSADSGSSRSTHTYEVVNAIAYRDIDFGSLDTSYILTFDASVGYSVNYARRRTNDGLAVFLADVDAVPMPPSSFAEMSPWGLLRELTPLANIYDTAWASYSIVLGSLTGVHRLVFYWYNYQSSYSSVTFVGRPAAVDNISVIYEPCPAPSDIRLVDCSASDATLQWHGSSSADYRVILYNSSGSLISDSIIHTNSIYYGALTPSASYSVRIARRCEGYNDVWSPIYYFSTKVCSDGSSDTVGDVLANYSCNDLPINFFYNYSYTQQLVLASELGNSGDITYISFLCNNSSYLDAKGNCTIYMAHTSLSSFASVTDVVPHDAFQVVYIGALNGSRGWVHILLDSPFAYNGTDNLVIAIDDNSGSAYNWNYGYMATETTLPMALSYFSNTDDVDCSTYNTLNAFPGTKSLCNHRAVMAFDWCPPNSCPAPRLRAPRVRVNDVTLRWNNTADRYLFGYRLATNNRWIVDNLPITDTFYVISNLFFDTDYLFHVCQYCDSDRISNWSAGSFNTADIPCLPPLGLRAYNITNNTVRLSWTPDDNNISYRVRVFNSAYDTIINTYVAGCRVRGLNAATRYYATVEVRCEYLDEPSIWSDTISFETDECPEVTDLTAVEVGGNSVLLDWQCDEGVGEWLIEWGLQGFDQGTGITVTADHHPFLLTGLTGETTYDIIVRSVCGDNFVSEGWSNRLTVTTAYSGIDTDTLTHSHIHAFSVLPNPTHADVELLLPVTASAVRVEVVDMAGRTMQTYTLPARTARATLATSQLPAGAYYVRLTSDRLSAVRKLLKYSD